MIVKALIRQEQQDSDKIRLEISWDKNHPGEAIQAFVQTKVESQLTQDFSFIYNQDNALILLQWDGTRRFGICIAYQPLENIFGISRDIHEFAVYGSHLITAQPNSWDEQVSAFFADYNNEVMAEFDKAVNVDWFAISVFGGTIKLTHDSNLRDRIANIFSYFPWAIFFLATSPWTSRGLELNFLTSTEQLIDPAEIYVKIDAEFDEVFWSQIYEYLTVLAHQDNKHTKMQRFLQLVFDTTLNETDPMERTATLHQHRDMLTHLDQEFLDEYVQTCLFGLSGLSASLEITEILISTAQMLLELERVDLAKLAEATALEVGLQLNNIQEREIIILQLTNRSLVWGNEHLTAFIQSLTGLLEQTPSDNQILQKAIEQVKPELQASWDGMVSLVEVNLRSENVYGAVDLRFDATKQIPDRYARRDDIINASVWSMSHKLNDQQLFEISKEYIRYVLENIPDEETMITQIDTIVQACIHNSRSTYLLSVLQLLRDSSTDFPNTYLQIIVDRFIPQLQPYDSFIQCVLELFLIKFLVLTEREEQPRDNEEYYSLISQLFNSINPNIPQAQELLIYVTRSCVELTLQLNDWGVIEEISRRFSLMFASSHADDLLREIFLQTALKRADTPSVQLKENDIGVRLFNEAISQMDLAEQPQIILDSLPKIKRMTVRARAYDEYTNLIILEIKLRKVLNQEWIDGMIEDIKLLLSKGKTLAVNMVFSESLNLDLEEQEVQQIISTQLQLSEAEPELLTPQEIFEKRSVLIDQIQTHETDHKEVLKNYRAGASELISKGDAQNLTRLLLQAINYCIEHQLTELKEFNRILLDSMADLLLDYTSSKSHELYLQALSILRIMLDRFGTSQLSLLYDLTDQIITTNLAIHQETQKNLYVRRNQLLLKELVLSLELDPNSPAVILELYDKLTDSIIARHNEFGMVETVINMAILYKQMKELDPLWDQIDKAIDRLKSEITFDPDAQSAVFLIILMLSEVYTILDADLYPERMTALQDRLIRVLAFAQSLSYDRQTRKNLKQMAEQAKNDISGTFQDFPFSIGLYLENFDLTSN